MIGYYPHLPTRPREYPDSVAEAELVKRRMLSPDREFFDLTDVTPVAAFTQYLDSKGIDYDSEVLRAEALKLNTILMNLKDYYNRPRPHQVSDIVPAESVSAATPAYPSGHAFQSYILADYLGRKHPRHYFAFRRIANRIADSRVSVGLHYPSDNREARRLADHFIR
tara:strand:+ start:2765 stop:3265 length:501 start_codon:yes stop_codon:yes gene_type:complete